MTDASIADACRARLLDLENQMTARAMPNLRDAAHRARLEGACFLCRTPADCKTPAECGLEPERTP